MSSQCLIVAAAIHGRIGLDGSAVSPFALPAQNWRECVEGESPE